MVEYLTESDCPKCGRKGVYRQKANPGVFNFIHRDRADERLCRTTAAKAPPTEA